MSVAPYIKMIGGGLQCSSLAKVWGVDAPFKPGKLDAAIVDWGGSAVTEFDSDAPLSTVLLARAVNPFRSDNYLNGRRSVGLSQDMRRDRFALIPAGTRIRAVNQPGAVLHIYLPAEALATAAGAEGSDLAMLGNEQLFADRTLMLLTDAIINELQNPSTRSLLFDETLAAALVSAIARAACDKPSISIVGGLATWQERRCREYLQEHLAEQVSLAALAQIANLSVFHFARMFKQTTGLSPAAYHRHLRYQKAQELLLSTDCDIGTVAAAVGYETPQAFARMFRAEAGLAPSDWRRERRL